MTLMNSVEVDAEIRLLIRADYPIIYINSHEEERVWQQLEQVRQHVLELDVQRMRSENMPEQAITEWQSKGRPLIRWSRTVGFQRDDKVVDNITDPLAALRWILKGEQWGGLYVFYDLHPYMGPKSRAYDAAVVRGLRDVATSFRHKRSTLILLSPVQDIPLELEKEIVVLNYPLPTAEDLDAKLDTVAERMRRIYGDECIALSAEERQELMRKSVGLTYEEVANVWAKALEQDGRLGRKDVEAINEEKRQVIQKSGLLEYYPADETFAQVGGLQGLKDWLRERKGAFLGLTPNHKLPTLKGILLIGVPGCGKSLSAKAVAAEWRVPLVRLDVGRIYDALLGQTEANFRKAVQIVEQLAPVVFWIDEVEKGFPQTTGSSDSGTSTRVLGSFLNWMQEKTRPVFVVATANDIERMPWELTRKGRFDEIFYVGLPTEQERREIFNIHLERWGLHLEPDAVHDLAQWAVDFTGAEIEQVVLNSLWAVPAHFDSGESFLPDEAAIIEVLHQTIDDIRPLAKRMEENPSYKKLHERAKQVAKPASGKEPEPFPVAQTPDGWR